MDYTSKSAATRAARNATRATSKPHIAIRVGPSASRMSGSCYRVVEQVDYDEAMARAGRIRARIEGK